MVTGEVWTEQVSFEGQAYAVVIVKRVEDYPGTRYELRLECLALDSSSGPLSLTVFLWDDREAGWCRDHYRSKFEVGTCWRISGKIDCYCDSLTFIDPVYMPFEGKASELLRRHAGLSSEV